LVERENPALPIAQQCRLLAVSRSAVYRKPAEVSAEDLAIMALIDRQYLVRPYYGSRRMMAWLATQGHLVNRKRVRGLMRLLGLAAIYQRSNTSKPAAAHKLYPYLLSGLAIKRVNQVWCSDVTYIPTAQGFLYLVVVMDFGSQNHAAASALLRSRPECPLANVWRLKGASPHSITSKLRSAAFGIVADDRLYGRPANVCDRRC
jgi:putative transposase